MDMKKYILYLEWFEAEKFYYQYKDRIKIEYCVADFNRTYPLKTFHDMLVLDLDAVKVKEENGCIIVCAENYFAVKTYLLRMGLREFRHFIPSGLVDKKLVVFHGNCYMQPLIKYLMNIQEFKEKYFVYSVPLIYNNSECEISEELLQVCDVFVHQNIHTKAYGEKLTDEWIMPRLSEQCLELVIPNFMGIYKGGVFFYPQCIGVDFVKGIVIQGEQFFHYKDNYIEESWRFGRTEEEVIRGIRSTDTFDRMVIQNVFDNSMLDLLEREQKWSVKISDYFLETYRIRQFFLDPGHPADHVIKEIAIRIAGKLGILIDKDDINDLDEEMLNWNEVPIYQCVKEVLHLGWEDNDELRKKSPLKLASGKMDIGEYVKEYIFFSRYVEDCVGNYNKGILAEWKNKGRLVVFGAGRWFRNYMENYGTEYMPDLLVDNDMKKWGNICYGIIVEKPQEIKSGDRIIVCCCKSEKDIGQQVKKMGINDIILYRPNTFIERMTLDRI